DEVDALAEVIDVQHGGIDRVLVFLLFFFEVGEGRAIDDGTFAVDRAGGKEHGIGQSRFPAAAMAGEQDIADVSGNVGGHMGWLLLLLVFSDAKRGDLVSRWEARGARE